MSLTEVCRTLGRERQLLQGVELALTRQPPADEGAGRCRALSPDVEALLDEVGRTELLRAVQVEAVAGRLRLPPGASLRELTCAAPPPWDGVLQDHGVALRATADRLASAPERWRVLQPSVVDFLR